MTYTATVTGDYIHVEKQQQAVGVYSGSIALTSYDTLAEITDITKMFKGGKPRVIVDGVSSNGYLCRWDSTAKAVRAFYPGIASAHTHDILIIGGGTITSTLGTDAQPALTKNAATNQTIAGANSATKGGVVAATPTPAAGSEVAAAVNVGTINFIAIGPAP